MALLYDNSNWIKNEGTQAFTKIVLPVILKRTLMWQLLSSENIASRNNGFRITVESQLENQKNDSIPYAIPWIISFCTTSLYFQSSGIFIFFS